MKQLDLLEWAESRPSQKSNVISAMPRLQKKAEAYLWGVLTKTLPPEHNDCVVMRFPGNTGGTECERSVA